MILKANIPVDSFSWNILLVAFLLRDQAGSSQIVNILVSGDNVSGYPRLVDVMVQSNLKCSSLLLNNSTQMAKFGKFKDDQLQRPKC